MSQSLDRFFSSKSNSKQPVCFVMDCEETAASFTSKPPPMFEFLGAIKGIRLYCRKAAFEAAWQANPVSRGESRVPLLKSNLQKAIRRGNKYAALWSAERLLALDPIALLRRLPIIAVEDVAPIDGTTEIVWFMAAHKYRALTCDDAAFIKNFVVRLATCSTIAKRKKPNRQRDNAIGPGFPNVSSALRLRATYGGMAGDMQMLLSAATATDEVLPPDIPIKLKDRLSDVPAESSPAHLLYEAIDFHPFPAMVRAIAKRTGVSHKEVRRLIWEAESAVNVRKPNTLAKSSMAMGEAGWTRIRDVLNQERIKLLQTE